MKKIRLGLALLLTAILVGSILVGCAGAKPAVSEPEQKQNVTLRVIRLGDSTGPYSVTVGPQLDGTSDFGKWSNETNYIPGITLDVRVYDHGLKLEQAVASYKEAVSSTPIPVITDGGTWSTAAPVIAGLAKQNHIPIIDSSPIKEAVIPPGWYFGYQPSYEGQVGAYVNWIVDNWKADSNVEWIRKHYENRKPRLALVSWDIALGHASESPENKCYAISKGVEWVGVEYVPLMVGDVTPQLSRLKNNVDFIYISMFPTAWQAVLKKADEMGMRDQFIDVGTTYFSPLEIAKFVPNLANNNGTLAIFVPGFDYFPKPIQEAQLKTKYPKDFGSYAVGWYHGDLFAEAIRQTINKVGADKVTGQTVYDTICSGAIKDFAPMLAINTITWANNSSLVKMEGGNTVYINVLQNWDPNVTPSDQCWKDYVISKDVPVPQLLPGGKDVPANCK